MASIDIEPISINDRLYRSVREGQAIILAPYRKPAETSQKQSSQPGQPRNNNEGDQAVFYNPIQQYNRDLSVLAILTYGESAIEIKQSKRQNNIGRIQKKKKKKKSAFVSPPLAEPAVRDQQGLQSDGLSSKKRKADDANLEKECDEDQDLSKRIRHQSHASDDIEICQLNSGRPDQIGQAPQNSADQHQDLNGNSDKSKHNTKKTQVTPFTILDALSASGLRAIRYAKEIPFATTIIANDVSPEAVEAINLNIEHNKLQDRVFSNVGDARQFMYSKTGNERPTSSSSYVHKFDVVDLDPYGTAAPFLDAAIQAVVDGGMLCVTCTDAGVWASNGYPEKAYALYSGVTIKGPQSHEAGLRLILHSIATSAAKYGIAVEPLLSLSIDFYARIFVRVHKSPQDVKLLSGTTMLIYNCDQGCGAWETQLVVRNQEKQAKNNEVYFKHGFAQGPSTDRYCEHCGTKTHLGGPLWAGPLHNPVFVQKILDKLPSADKTIYGTTDRIRGMLTVALEEEDIDLPGLSKKAPAHFEGMDQPAADEMACSESSGGPMSLTTSSLIPRLPPQLLSHSPFFFLPTYLARVLSLPTPGEDPLRGAFLALGYACTRSHCKPGSFKTNAPWSVIWEVIREWARQTENDRIPRLLGEGEFDGKGSVKKSSPGWNILKRLRGRPDNAQAIVRLKEDLLRKLGHGSNAAHVLNAADLQDVLKSTLYELERLSAGGNQVLKATESLAVESEQTHGDINDVLHSEVAKNGNISGPENEGRKTRNAEPLKISGKALIDQGGDPSELLIVFDAKLGRAFKESKGGKLVRYQINPRANWGPMVRAGGIR